MSDTQANSSWTVLLPRVHRLWPQWASALSTQPLASGAISVVQNSPDAGTASGADDTEAPPGGHRHRPWPCSGPSSRARSWRARLPSHVAQDTRRKRRAASWWCATAAAMSAGEVRQVASSIPSCRPGSALLQAYQHGALDDDEPPHVRRRRPPLASAWRTFAVHRTDFIIPTAPPTAAAPSAASGAERRRDLQASRHAGLPQPLRLEGPRVRLEPLSRGARPTWSRRPRWTGRDFELDLHARRAGADDRVQYSDGRWSWRHPARTWPSPRCRPGGRPRTGPTWWSARPPLLRDRLLAVAARCEPPAPRRARCGGHRLPPGWPGQPTEPGQHRGEACS